MPWQRRLYGVAALFLVVSSIRPGASWRELGLSSRHLLRGNYVPAVAALLAAVSVGVAAHQRVLHAPGSPGAFLRRFWGYILWSFAQQFLLQDFFFLRLRRLFPERPGLALLLSAGIFAFTHVPNPLLTAFTLVWGLAACWAFERYRNLYSLGLAHALLGICVAICLPAHLTHHMRVGLGYLTFHPGVPHRRVSDHTLSTKV